MPGFMSNRPLSWQYDEFKQVGRDYGSKQLDSGVLGTYQCNRK